jgi:hypothetical protein
LQAPENIVLQIKNDGTGDSLDACLCAISSAWALLQYQNGDYLWGLSSAIDLLEGEIISAHQCSVS